MIPTPTSLLVTVDLGPKLSVTLAFIRDLTQTLLFLMGGGGGVGVSSLIIYIYLFIHLFINHMFNLYIFVLEYMHIHTVYGTVYFLRESVHSIFQPRMYFQCDINRKNLKHKPLIKCHN